MKMFCCNGVVANCDDKFIIHLTIIHVLLCPVVNAAHTFYNGTTTLPISEEDRTPRKRISKTLNMTTNPEEKRKIIGDTFVKVREQRFVLMAYNMTSFLRKIYGFLSLAKDAIDEMTNACLAGDCFFEARL